MPLRILVEWSFRTKKNHKVGLATRSKKSQAVANKPGGCMRPGRFLSVNLSG